MVARHCTTPSVASDAQDDQPMEDDVVLQLR